MNMNINKIKEKLNVFFDLSDNKQKKKQDKLISIHESLKNKHDRLKKELKKIGLKKKNSKKYKEISKEFKAVVKLIKKAEQRIVVE